MSSTEKPLASVQDSMSRAEGRINKSTMDVSVNAKLAVMNTENAIKKNIEDYKRLGIYEEVQKQFNAAHASESITAGEVKAGVTNVDTPEYRLSMMAFRFDRMSAEESEYAGQELNLLVAETTKRLTELKSQLNASAQEVHDFDAKAEASETVQRSANYIYKPENVGDTVKNVAEMLGEPVNVDKMLACQEENEDMYTELTDPQNSRKMKAGNTEFASVTGFALGEVDDKMQAALLKARDLVLNGSDKAAARKEFFSVYKKVLDVYNTANEVMTNVLFNEGHTALEEAGHSLEGSEHSDLLTEDQMSMLLDLAVNGVSDPTFFKQLLDVKAAQNTYKKMAGDASKNLLGVNMVDWMAKNLPASLQNAYHWLMANDEAFSQGVLDGAVGTVEGAAHFVRHPVDSLTALAHMPGLAYENRAKIAQMLKYGWENSTPLQKSLMVSQIMGEVAGGVAATAGMGASASGLMEISGVGKALSTAAHLSRQAALTTAGSAGELLLMTAEAILARVPALVKYGSNTEEVVTSLAENGAALLKKAEHFGHKAAHTAEHALHRAETASHYAHEAHSRPADALAEESPTYKQIDALTGDVKLAQENSAVLGLSAKQIATLQNTLSSLGSIDLPEASATEAHHG